VYTDRDNPRLIGNLATYAVFLKGEESKEAAATDTGEFPLSQPWVLDQTCNIDACSRHGVATNQSEQQLQRQGVSSSGAV